MNKNQNSKQKVKVYIDGANMFYAQKKLGWNFDWSKIKDYIEAEKEVAEWKYYAALKKDDDKMQSYLKYLDTIGFDALTKPLKKIKISNDDVLFQIYQSNYIFKANFDVEITTDILLDKSNLDEIIIFTGDSDFEYLIKKLKDIGRKIIIFSSRKTISWELKLAASDINYLEDIKDKIKRE